MLHYSPQDTVGPDRTPKPKEQQSCLTVKPHAARPIPAARPHALAEVLARTWTGHAAE